MSEKYLIVPLIETVHTTATAASSKQQQQQQYV